MVRADLEAYGLAAAGQVLRAEAAGLAAEWEIECRGDPPLPDSARVFLALADALGIGPAAAEAEPVPSLHVLASSLVEGDLSLDVIVRHLGGLREVLHRRMVAALPPAAALEAQHAVNGAIDTLVELCTAAGTDSLQRGAFLDPLTGLLNRRALERDLTRELALAARQDGQLTVVVGDLDGLKTVNDTLGHAAGDEALCALASSLRVALRAADAAYRVGGDEFVMVLPASPAADVAGVVERVVAASAPPFGWGSASFPVDGDAPAQLLDVADHRLLASRRAARGGGPEPASAAAPGPDGAPRHHRRRRLLLAATLLIALMLTGVGLFSLPDASTGAGGKGRSGHRVDTSEAITPAPPLEAPTPCAPAAPGAGRPSTPPCGDDGPVPVPSPGALTPAEASAAALLGSQPGDATDE